MKWLSLILITPAVLVGANTALSQGTCTTQPGYVCLSQAAANKAAENARELEATKQKVTVLEGALAEKDKSITELKATAQKNETDLKLALADTQAKLAQKTGEVIQMEADKVRWTAVIDVLLKNSRKKCMPLSVCL